MSVSIIPLSELYALYTQCMYMYNDYTQCVYMYSDYTQCVYMYIYICIVTTFLFPELCPVKTSSKESNGIEKSRSFPASNSLQVEKCVLHSNDKVSVEISDLSTRASSIV